MNRIDELIYQYCPDGVEFKTLADITIWDKRFNGVGNKTVSFKHVSAAQLKQLEVTDGDVRLLATGKFNGYTTEEIAGDYLNEGEVITIPSGGSANLKYYRGKFVDSGNILAIAKNDRIDLKFIYYFLLTKNELIQSYFRGSGVAHPSMSEILQIKIPVPPVEVQKEIVNILDKFTQLEAELSAELSAELEARRRQYEYYRNQLVSERVFGSTEWAPLESVMTIKTGTKPSVIEKMLYMVPYINAGNEPSGYTNYKNTNGGVITIPSRGQGSAGHVGYQSQDFWCGPLCYRVDSTTDRLLNKFIYYYLKNIQNKIVELRKIGSIPAVNKSDLGKVMIPVPPVLEQEKIIKILDNFDKLTNDISEGLPAEIAARRKQYEYYRTKLLTFKELK